MIRTRALAAVALFGAAVGCSGTDGFAPVSGVVTIDGVPYAKAVVSFQPLGTKDAPNPGRGSSAYTDEHGRFVLKCDSTIDGARIGRHQVRIMTRGNDVIGQLPEGGSPDGAPAGKVDPIPAEWNANSKVEFDVPKGGTDQANFDIVIKKNKK